MPSIAHEIIADNIGGFSAVCWLFGRRMNQKFDIPIGLVQSALGGTRIQRWSSEEAILECYDAVEDAPMFVYALFILSSSI